MSGSVQVSITKAYSGCPALKWRSMILRTPLKGVSLSGLSYAEPSFFLFRIKSALLKGSYFLVSQVRTRWLGTRTITIWTPSLECLKLYFRGLENALFPKEVFHDLMSCVCECPLYILHPRYTCAQQTRLDNGEAFVLNKHVSCSCCFFQPWRTSRTELSTSTKSCCVYPAALWLSCDTCSLSSTSKFRRSKLVWNEFSHQSNSVLLFICDF